MDNQYKDLQEIFTFYAQEDGKEIYHCKCGATFETEMSENDKIVEEILSEGDSDDDLVLAIERAQVSLKGDIKCPSCGTNYKLPINQKRLVKSGDKFSSSFEYIKTNECLELHVKEISSDIDGEDISFNEDHRYIKYSLTSNDVYYFDGEITHTIDISNAFKYLEEFFQMNTLTVDNTLHLQIFVSELSKITPDAKDMSVISFYKNQGSSIESLLDSHRKMTIVFTTIIKYSNLSTIVLTKNPDFLYDTLKYSSPPDSYEFQKNKVTSPVKIFNFLAKSYISKVNSEVDEEIVTNSTFTFKNENKTWEVEFKNVLDDYTPKAIELEDGKVDVQEINGTGEVSKFVYKNLREFRDYQKIVKYFKLVDHKGLVDIMTKFNYDLVLEMIDVLYYRDGVDVHEIKRLSYLFEEHCVNETRKFLKSNFKYVDENFKVDYSHVKNFNFEFYNDCLLMINTLEFDPRKHFYKIKSLDKLKEYHDNLVKYYSAIQLEEEGGYKGFFDQFKYLEKNEEYEGNLSFELIDTPRAVVNEGSVMHHSVGSYANRLLRFNYVLLRVYYNNEDIVEDELVRFTMGLNYNKSTGLKFDQLKGVTNKPASNRIREEVLDWMVLMGIDVDERRPDIKLK